jgi:hypothetical protein
MAASAMLSSAPQRHGATSARGLRASGFSDASVCVTGGRKVASPVIGNRIRAHQKGEFVKAVHALTFVYPRPVIQPVI